MTGDAARLLQELDLVLASRATADGDEWTLLRSDGSPTREWTADRAALMSSVVDDFRRIAAACGIVRDLVRAGRIAEADTAAVAAVAEALPVAEEYRITSGSPLAYATAAALRGARALMPGGRSSERFLDGRTVAASCTTVLRTVEAALAA